MSQDAEHELPPPAKMLQIITGYWISQAVGVTARLGVADHLAKGPKDVDEIATAVSANPQALYRLLRMLASIGVFTLDSSGRFGLTQLGETLRSNVPGSVRDFAIAETAHGHWEPWGKMYGAVKTGKSMSKEALGMEIFEWYSRNPQEAEYFNAAMGNLSAAVSGEVVRVYDFSKFQKIADIGGAHGVLLRTILKANPSAIGILFDLPHVIETAKKPIAAQEIGQRCELVSGDFFKEVPAGADLHVLKQIVHDWDDERATLLLRNCHEALKPKGKLLLVEMVIPPDNAPSMAQAMDLNMLVMLSGRERTEGEYQGLLEGAGFTMERVIPTHSPFSIIEAARA